MNKLHLSVLDDYLIAENMIKATNIILNHGLDLSHYTKEDYDPMDELRVRVQTYLDAKIEDSITARRQFERFEDALYLWKTNLRITRNMNKIVLCLFVSERL